MAGVDYFKQGFSDGITAYREGWSYSDSLLVFSVPLFITSYQEGFKAGYDSVVNGEIDFRIEDCVQLHLPFPE